MTSHIEHNIRETSVETYLDIELDESRIRREDLVYNYILCNGGETGREIAHALGFDDMNSVRPRISDLFKKGLIIYGNKRKDNYSYRSSSEVYTVGEFERLYLNKLGFRKLKDYLYVFYGPNYVLYQDFRDGKRKSYAVDFNGKKINHKDLEVHKVFKELLERNTLK